LGKRRIAGAAGLCPAGAQRDSSNAVKKGAHGGNMVSPMLGSVG